MTALTTIAPRLRQLILLLSSSHPGEVTNAAAIGRTLKTAGIDWHAFAAAIEPTIPKAEMQRLYDAGYDAGVQAAENKHHDGDDFINTDGSPSWHRVAGYCQHHIDRLDERYHRFVNDMAGRTVYNYYEPTEKQRKYLLSLFYRLGGELQQRFFRYGSKSARHAMP